jgi:signal transduction histidine kinase
MRRFVRSLGRNFDALRRRMGSIRVRLALWYLTIMTALLVFFSVLLVTTLVNLAPSYHAHLMLRHGERLAATYQPQTGQVHLEQPLPEAGDVVVVIGGSGAVTQTVGPISPSALAALRGLAKGSQDASLSETSSYALPRASTRGGTTAHVAYDVYTIAVLHQGQRVATLLLASPSGVASRIVPLRFSWFAVLGILIVATAGAGGFWLVTRALRPVRLVTQTAREISMSDLSRRLNVSSADELGELAATFDQMLGRIDEAFARQRRFTADASHELRAPLAVIQLEAARMLEQPSTHQECLEALAQIGRTSAAMAQMVEQLLVLARSDDGALTGEAVECDLSDRVYDVAERMVPMAQQSHLELRLGTLPAVLVRGDPQALDRMIGNVVENAIKYAAGVGHLVTVETGQRPKHGELWGWVEVTDDGPGIAAEHLPHIFERFYRADAARTRAASEDEEPARGHSTAVNGTGLGLAIAQAIAMAHGGEIQVQSGLGEGCRVTIWLPLAWRSSASSVAVPAHVSTQVPGQLSTASRPRLRASAV